MSEDKIKTDSDKSKKEQFLLMNQGKAFSPEGVCSVPLFWAMTIFCPLPISVLSAFLSIGSNFFAYSKLDISQLGQYVFAFWLNVLFIAYNIYERFLCVKRFRAIDMNPWKALIPIYGFLVAYLLPSKKDCWNNYYFSYKIKRKPLFLVLLYGGGIIEYCIKKMFYFLLRLCAEGF